MNELNEEVLSYFCKVRFVLWAATSGFSPLYCTDVIHIHWTISIVLRITGVFDVDVIFDNNKLEDKLQADRFCFGCLSVSKARLWMRSHRYGI